MNLTFKDFDLSKTTENVWLIRAFCCVLFIATCFYLHSCDYLIVLFVFIDDQHQKETEELGKDAAEKKARPLRERHNFFTACLNLSRAILLTLSLFLNVVKSLICNTNTQVGGLLFLAAGSLTHPSLTRRLTSTPHFPGKKAGD